MELQRTNFSSSYTTVWRQFEDAAIDALAEVLPKHIPQLSQTNFDRGESGREKNRLADLAILCGDGQIEISVKSARRSANPENDLGTFRDHPNRKKMFAASFTLWVRYDDSGKEIKCDRVFFDRSWRFVGRSTLVDGVKYRKKDGNMRPKPCAMFDSDAAYWNSEKDFEAAVKRASSGEVSIELCDLLRKKGGNINASLSKQSAKGWTALHYAAVNGDIELVRYLVKYGANVNKSTGEGSTPLFLAKLGNHKEVVQILKKAGAQE